MVTMQTQKTTVSLSLAPEVMVPFNYNVILPCDRGLPYRLAQYPAPWRLTLRLCRPWQILNNRSHQHPIPLTTLLHPSSQQLNPGAGNPCPLNQLPHLI